MTSTKLPPPPRVLPGSPVPLLLLGLAWFATPVLLFVAVMGSTAWFGEAPSDEDLQLSRTLVVAAIGTGVVGPAVGTVLALAWRRRVAAGLLGGALLITLGAMAWLQLQ
jgi:hypothetical protein